MFDEVVRGTARDYIRIMPERGAGRRELICRMTRGETRALRELYARHARLVYGLALRIVGDKEAAEEICQDVFLRAWEKADTYRQREGAGAHVARAHRPQPGNRRASPARLP